MNLRFKNKSTVSVILLICVFGKTYAQQFNQDNGQNNGFSNNQIQGQAQDYNPQLPSFPQLPESQVPTNQQQANAQFPQSQANNNPQQQQPPFSFEQPTFLVPPASGQNPSTTFPNPQTSFPAPTTPVENPQISFQEPQTSFQNPQALSPEHSQIYQDVTNGAERFSIDLFHRILLASENQTSGAKYNFIISPFSVWSLLTLTAEGAQGNTYRELQRALGLPNELSTSYRAIYSLIQNVLSVNSSSVEVTATQTLFSDKNRPINPEYESIIEGYYKTDQLSVDFLDSNNTAKIINNHISQVTRGKIRKLVDSADLKDAALILASAIFFKGQWKVPFNRSHTTVAPFYDDDGRELGKVNMMFQRGAFPYTAIADLEAHILELPYGTDNRLSMMILLPRKGVTLARVIELLKTVRLQRIYHELRKSEMEFEDDEVEVYLPRFGFVSNFVLNLVLEQMGISDLFSANHADLSKITSTPAFLSRLLHKARIEVTEEGTVASAVTAGIFANKATPPRFNANRPFAYLIVDKLTNTLLFCGQTADPIKFKL